MEAFSAALKIYWKSSGNRTGQLSIDLEHPYRLLFIPANDPIPVTQDGGLNWAKVTEIEIVEIADTH